MISEDDFKYVTDWAELSSLNGLWAYISPNMLPSLDIKEDKIPFEKRKKLFFYFLNRLLKEGRLKLAKNGHLLTSSMDEQIKLFTDAFPKTEQGLFDEQALMDDYWFFDESCPAGAVWVREDGSLEWT